MTALANALAPTRLDDVLVPATTSQRRTVADDGLLRRRVSLYFQVLLFVQLGLMLCCEVATVIGIAPQVTTEHDRSLNIMGVGVVAGLWAGWQFARRGRASARTLLAIETASSVLLSGIYVYAAMLCDPGEGATSGMMLVALTLMLRASLVPSPVARTLIVGASSLAVAGACFAHHGGVDAARQVGSAIMGAAFVAGSGVASQVIYGLRRDVRAARRLGPYELGRKLGQGGMGVVYEATHVLLRRPTAVKVLPIDAVGEQTVARFEREVKQTSRLEHPNSVYIYDYGRTPDGQFYYAMEYIDGVTLEDLVASAGPLPPARAVRILIQAAEALAEAHTLGLVHRDVKPANIMVCVRGQRPDTVKVVDFGLVKELERADGTVTSAGTIVGTPHYLAPEAIARPNAATPATDVYALGAVAYYLLTGRRVFEADNVIAACSRHLSDVPEPPSQHAPAPLDAALESLVLRCLAKAPETRFADGGALATALSELDTPEWKTAHARRWQTHSRRRAC